MLLSSPFVLRIYSLPLLYFEQKQPQRGMVSHSENQNKGHFINFVVTLSKDKLQDYE